MAQVMRYTLQDVHKLQMEGINNNDIQKLTEAEAIYHRMLSQDPDNWAILFFLGSIAMYRDMIGLAINLFKRAAEINPNSPEIYNNLGTAYRREHMNAESEKYLLKGLEFKEDADIYNNLGTLHINEGSPSQGEKYFKKALALNPAHAQAHWNYGLCLLEMEKWGEGFKEYAWGVTSKDRLNKSYQNAVWWNGEPDPNGTIVVYGEQGIGDEIMFASMVKELVPMFKQVVLDCHPRLIGLFQRAFPEIECFPTRKTQTKMDWVEGHSRIDYKIAIGNLGKFLRKQESDFPKEVYLKADQQRVDEYKEWLSLLGPGPYIGLSWVGGHKRTRKDLRAVLLENWLPIFEANKGATFISLQYTDQSWELEPLLKEHGIKVHHFPEVTEATKWEVYEYDGKRYTSKDEAKFAAGRDHLDDIVQIKGPAFDYDETAALAKAIDEMSGCVITVNTSLVHLCGALGVKTFVMTPSRPAWRYGLKRRDMVWYGPHVTQYRQKEGDDWKKVIDLIAKESSRYLNQNKVVRIYG